MDWFIYRLDNPLDFHKGHPMPLNLGLPCPGAMNTCLRQGNVVILRSALGTLAAEAVGVTAP